MAVLFSRLVLMAFVVQYCVAKPVEHMHGYPEENRDVDNPFLFEGDILISPRQKEIALSGGDVGLATGRKRAATAFGIWPNGKIPYLIDPLLDVYEDVIKSAMREWEKHTCIRFVPWSHERYFLKIRFGSGCSSVVGFFPIPGVPLTLGTGCYSNTTILHELGHAIGFWHEQSRPDRDNYVKILKANIIKGRESEFDKHPIWKVNSRGQPYDYNSIMHYGPKTFSKSSNLVTIESKDPNIKLKKNTRLSRLDIAQTNQLYNCQGPDKI